MTAIGRLLPLEHSTRQRPQVALTGSLLLYIHRRIADIGKKYLHCSKADAGHGQQPTHSSHSARRKSDALSVTIYYMF